jgi:glycosyltransferase 2 family protein
MKKAIIGLIVAAICIYLSIRGVVYEKVLENVQNVNARYFIPAIILFISGTILRSVRLGIMLSPLEKISQKLLFPITCVGFLAITLIPMRAGELVRPYLIKTKSQIPFTSSLGTIFVERVLDLSTLVFLFLFAMLASDLPKWVIYSGYTSLLIIIAIICLMLLFVGKTDSFINLFRPLLKRFPEKIDTKIVELVRNFVSGLKILSSLKNILYIVFLTLLIWVFAALSIYSLYFSLNLNLPFISSFVVLFITMIGISLPTAPGFIGNWQYGCILALAIYGINKNEALAFSLVYYLCGMIMTILLGLVFLPSTSISIKNIRKELAVIRGT